MKVTVIYQILLVSLLLVGCTKVDLCDSRLHIIGMNWAYLPMKRLRNYIL